MDPTPESLDAHDAPYLRRTLTTQSLHFNGAATQSEMDVRHPDRLHLSYTRLMMGFLLFIPSPQAVGLIGLGGGSLAKFIHRQWPESQIDVVEIDPRVIALRDAFGVPADSTRFRVHCADGAEFVHGTENAFDALLVDGFDASGQPAALASQAFYDDCARCLRADGVLVVNLHTRDAGFASQVQGMRQAFGGEVLVVPDEDDCNSIAFASRAALQPRIDPGTVLRLHRQDRQAWFELLPVMSRLAKRAQRMARP
jgi:spermidine synthase